MAGDNTPKVMALSPDDERWLAQRLQAAQESGLLDSDDNLAEAFDDSRDEYQALMPHKRGDPAMLVDIFAVAFGDHISREFDLDWCVVERGDTAEIGLFGEDSQLMLYPLATVKRRWQDAAMRPMSDLIEQTRASLSGV